MNTTTVRQRELASRPRPLGDAYTELLLQGAQADPNFGFVILCREQGDDTTQPLHRGMLKVLGNLSYCADEESIDALAGSLRELFEVHWLTTPQVKTLLELADRPADLTSAECEARPISVSNDGQSELEAYGTRIRFERDWWTLSNPEGQELANCLQLDSALQHARLMRQSTPAKR